MSWLDDATDFVGEAVSDAADAVSDAGSVAGEAIESVADAGVQVFAVAAEDTYDVAEAVADAGTSVITVAEDGASTLADPFFEAAGAAWDEVGDPVLTVLDDTVFDNVDTLTLGVIDFDYDNGQFSTKVGIGGLADEGFSIGKDGVSAYAHAAGMGGTVHADGSGIGAAGSLGFDVPGLPYVDVDAGVGADGQLHTDFYGQGYVPLPGVVVGGEAGFHYIEKADGFDLSTDLTGRAITGGGEEIAAGGSFAYSEDRDGYHASGSGHVEVGQVGGPHVGVSAGYAEGRDGDRSFEQVSAEAHVSGAGYEAGAGVDVRHESGPDGETTVVQGEAHVAVDGVGSADGSITVADGPDGTTVETDGHLDVGPALDQLEEHGLPVGSDPDGGPDYGQPDGEGPEPW